VHRLTSCCYSCPAAGHALLNSRADAVRTEAPRSLHRRSRDYRIPGRPAESRSHSPADSRVAVRLHILHGGVLSTAPPSSPADDPLRASGELGAGSHFNHGGGVGGAGDSRGPVAPCGGNRSRAGVRSDQQLRHCGSRVSPARGTEGRSVLDRSVLGLGVDAAFQRGRTDRASLRGDRRTCLCHLGPGDGAALDPPGTRRPAGSHTDKGRRNL
jgi:hypothetical protein